MALPEQESLGDFFDYIYGTQTGYAYVARKQPQSKTLADTTPAWLQQFFQWPQERANLIQHVLDHRAEWEVYYGPALYRDGKDASKVGVQSSSVLWVEFDGNRPEDVLGLPEPTMRVQSSEEGHEHWYWRLDAPAEPELIEKINRSLTYIYKADSSGWDSTQVLRPPETYNHKRQRNVAVLDSVDISLPIGLFDGLPEPPPPVEIPVPERIPDVNDVVFRYKFSTQVANLFKQGVPVGQRSSGLMSLGYSLAEMNLTNEEMLSILLNADQRWGKFSDRSDRLTRLLEIVTIARQKFPHRTSSDGVGEPQKLVPMGFKTFLSTDINLEWVWEGWLQKNGYYLLTGPSGVGKTQFSLDAAGHLALGKTFLDRPVTQAKIGFFSLEMGHADLKEFMLLLKAAFTPEEQEVLEEQLLIFPLGEPLYLNNGNVRSEIEQIIGDYHLDGVFYDSLGSATDENVSDEAIKKLFHWNDRVRQKMQCFTWFIHHHRKASSENKKPNKLSDVYGSQYITSYATSVMCMWESTLANAIQMIPLKVRLSKKPSEFNMHRDGSLHFTKMAQGLDKPAPVELKEGIAQPQKYDPDADLSIDLGV